MVVITMFATLYYAGPNARVQFRWLSPGGVLAVAAWLVASGLFAVYTANFGSYNATYGSLGGVIIFLVWMWITNVALLVGLEFNAELERARELEAGEVEAEQRITLPPRDEPAKTPPFDGLTARLRAWRRRKDRSHCSDQLEAGLAIGRDGDTDESRYGETVGRQGREGS